MARDAESNRRPVTAHHFVQPPANLAQRTVFHGANQFRKNVTAPPDDRRKAIQRAFRLQTMAAFEFFQAVELQLLPRARRADNFHFG